MEILAEEDPEGLDVVVEGRDGLQRMCPAFMRYYSGSDRIHNLHYAPCRAGRQGPRMVQRVAFSGLLNSWSEIRGSRVEVNAKRMDDVKSLARRAPATWNPPFPRRLALYRFKNAVRRLTCSSAAQL